MSFHSLITNQQGAEMELSLRKALSNVLKHADAARIDLTLASEAPGSLTALITDNG